jgi:hypothetical protein
MKYCHECGTKLEEKEENAPILKTKEGMNHKKSRMLKAAGTLVLIAAIISIYIGVFGIGFSWEQSYDSYDGYGGYNHYNYHPEKLATGIFGLFGFVFGVISCTLLYTRKMFSLSIIGLGILFLAAALSAVLGLPAFIVLGLPILIIGTISTVFVCISRKEFSS